MTNILELIQYLGYKLVSGLLYSFTLVYFYSTADIMDNFYLLIIQEFYFSFFLTFYRVRVVAKSNSFSILGMIILSSMVVLGIYYSLNNPLDGILLMLSAVIYPVYLIFASCIEKNDFSHAIKIENISALSAVIVFFVLSLFMKLLGLEWIGLIYLRFFIFFALIIIYFISRENINECIKKINPFKAFSLKEFLLLDIIILLMFFKFSIVTVGILSTDSSSLDVKIFLFLYDFIAAVYGFYMRFIVSRDSKIYGLQKESLLIYSFLSFSFLLIFIFYFSTTILSEEVLLTLFSSFVLAASFGIFVLNTFKNIRYLHSAILILSTIGMMSLGLRYTSVFYFISIVSLVLYMDYNVKYSK